MISFKTQNLKLKFSTFQRAGVRPALYVYCRIVMRPLLYFCAFMPILLCFSSCSKKTQPEKKEKILHQALSTDPTTLDPAFIVDIVGGQISAKLFNSLVRYSPDMTIVPDLAEKWESSADGLSYTFYLRQRIHFYNEEKTELTAYDVKYSFERVLSPKTLSPRNWVFQHLVGAEDFIQGKTDRVEGIQLINKYTIKLVLQKPFAPFLGLLTMPNAYIVPQKQIEKYGKDFSNHPVGTGPFMLDKWEHGHKITLKANRNYFESPPKISGIEYKIIPENLAKVADFESGNLDSMEIPETDYARYKKDPKWSKHIIEQSNMNIYYLGFNCQIKPLNNPIVRLAINYAVDVETINKKLYGSKNKIAHGPIPPGLPGYSPTLKRYAYNPQKTKDLLKSAGLGKGFKLEIWLRTKQESLEICELIQGYLRNVGINAVLIQRDWSALKESINKGEAQSFLMNWEADYPDAENFLSPLFYSANWGAGGNRARYKNLEVDKLLELAQQTMDTDKRVALYKKIEKKIVSDAPWLFLWHSTTNILYQSNIKGTKIYPTYNGDKGLDVFIE